MEDLISRKALRTEVENYQGSYALGGRVTCEEQMGFGMAKSAMVHKIINAPKVDAIPVEWILGLVGDEETYTLSYRHAWSTLVSLWDKEQEG